MASSEESRWREPQRFSSTPASYVAQIRAPRYFQPRRTGETRRRLQPAPSLRPSHRLTDARSPRWMHRTLRSFCNLANQRKSAATVRQQLPNPLRGAFHSDHTIQMLATMLLEESTIASSQRFLFGLFSALYRKHGTRHQRSLGSRSGARYRQSGLRAVAGDERCVLASTTSLRGAPLKPTLHGSAVLSRHAEHSSAAARACSSV